MRWSAVFAGTALAVGLWILLQVLGMGLGLSAVDVDDAGSLKSVGIGTGIWSLIAPLIALFFGGMLAGRLDGSGERSVGAMHGSVTWALATVIGLWAVMSLVTTLVNGVAHVGSTAVQASSAVVSNAARAGASIDPTQVLSTLGIDSNDLVGPINARLQREGKPPITADEVEATLKGVAQRGVKQGRLDRDLLIQEIARNTALSPVDAEDIATDIDSRYQSVAGELQARAGEVTERAKDIALAAVDKTGKTLLLGGLMMLLTFGSAVGGAALGVRDRRRIIDREIENARRTTVPPADRIIP